MPLIIDPAEVELKALKKATAWRGKRVLELGCGDGRLTLRLASLGPSRIDALDPDPDEIRLARRNLPAKRSGLIHYAVGQAEHIRKSDGAFDIVVFSWAL
jgi:ubiquinone/menaquinone biosynthesis C-methylase UbiE